MTDNSEAARIRIRNAKESYAAIAVIFIPALQIVLEELVARVPADDYGWFDELEAHLIREAKGTIIEGLPVEVEAESLKAGIELLQTTINVVRKSLIDRSAA